MSSTASMLMRRSFERFCAFFALCMSRGGQARTEKPQAGGLAVEVRGRRENGQHEWRRNTCGRRRPPGGADPAGKRVSIAYVSFWRMLRPRGRGVAEAFCCSGLLTIAGRDGVALRISPRECLACSWRKWVFFGPSWDICESAASDAGRSLRDVRSLKTGPLRYVLAATGTRFSFGTTHRRRH